MQKVCKRQRFASKSLCSTIPMNQNCIRFFDNRDLDEMLWNTNNKGLIIRKICTPYLHIYKIYIEIHGDVMLQFMFKTLTFVTCSNQKQSKQLFFAAF